MFRWLRDRGFSGEQGGERVAHFRDRTRERRINETLRPGLNPKLQQTLRDQNANGDLEYFDALRQQRGESIAADGSPARLGVVDRETGRIVEPFIRETEDTEPNPDATPPPPPPTSAA